MNDNTRPAPDTILAARNITVSFHTREGLRTVVDDAGLTVQRGVVTALVGESGSGKSQMIHAILGLTRGTPGTTGGSAWIQPRPGVVEPLLETPEGPHSRPRFVARYRRLNEQLSVVFQGVDSHLNPFHRVKQQIVRRAGLLAGGIPTSEGGHDEFVHRTLAPFFPGETAAIHQIARSFPSELSGGQRMRLSLCIALLSPAPLVIADEPTTGLDPGLRLEIYRILRRAVDEAGQTLLLISHDVEMVARFARNVYVMREGRIVEHAMARPVTELRDEYSRGLFLPLPVVARRLTNSSAYLQIHEGPERARPESARLEDAGPEDARLEDSGPEDSRPEEPILEARGICKSFSVDNTYLGECLEVAAVKDVEVVLCRGEAVGLVGESGCGKSTLARVLAGLLQPEAGTVRFRPRGTKGQIAPTEPGYRRFVQLLHQNPDTMLHPRVTVGGLCRDSMGLWGERCAFRKISDFLEFSALRLEDADLYPGSLSGGERRRIGLARVMAGRPELVLADEVASGLDRTLQAHIFRSLESLRSAGLTLMVISHDLDLVRHLCDRVLVMKDGRIVDSCRSADLLIDRREHHAYTRFLLEAESLGSNGNQPRPQPPPFVPVGRQSFRSYLNRIGSAR